MSNKIVVSPSPHLHSGESTRRVMRDVIIALLPALAISALYFGLSALVVTLSAVAFCLLAEWLISRFLMGKSSMVTSRQWLQVCY